MTLSNLTTKALGRIGRPALAFGRRFRDAGRLAARTFLLAVREPFRGKRIPWNSPMEQMVRFGIDSTPIALLIAFFVGLIIAMQSAYQLKQFGATIFVADLVAVSLTRELAPLLTAIIITGRNGSAITAEIGTMQVSEEIDALRTMGLDPLKYLVLPRMLAMLIMLPCLTVIADLVGIFGGYVITVAGGEISGIRYINQTISALTIKDLLSGLIKSVFFALIIAINGCYQGMIARGGAEGVGRVTTRSVVGSIVLIITADVVFTALFFSAL